MSEEMVMLIRRLITMAHNQIGTLERQIEDFEALLDKAAYNEIVEVEGA